MATMIRTDRCGQLSEADAGRPVVLAGWVAAHQEHGRLVFLHLRDASGTVQVVVDAGQADDDSFATAGQLGDEYVVRVEGQVVARPGAARRDKLVSPQTQGIEVLARQVEILGKSLLPPFPIRDTVDASEDLRLQYRYLDLRRSPMQAHLRLRSRVMQAVRDYLLDDERGFVEVETPILSRSTAEGARVFLVPSRLEAGSFYSLPQSPQLYKQLLMIGGVERYSQIARCFRDEDARADRQPEFSQIDLEMAFVKDPEEILDLVEGLVCAVFAAAGHEIERSFPRMTYREAMERYGTDKPDLRSDEELARAADGEAVYRFLWVVDFPLLKPADKGNGLKCVHHPFTAPHPEDVSKLASEPLAVRGLAYDLVLNGEELGGGSLRIHRRELQETILRLLGHSTEEMASHFGFFLRALQFGAPPHGGIALGLDRLLWALTGAETMRDVIAFPKTQNTARCLLMETPAQVGGETLDELQLRP